MMNGEIDGSERLGFEVESLRVVHSCLSAALGFVSHAYADESVDEAERVRVLERAVGVVLSIIRGGCDNVSDKSVL